MLRGDSLQVLLFFVALGAALWLQTMSITPKTRLALRVSAIGCLLVGVVATTAGGWWPWLARTSSELAASPVSWFVVVMFIVFMSVLRAAPQSAQARTVSQPVLVTPPASPPPPPLGGHYDEEDRRRARNVLR